MTIHYLLDENVDSAYAHQLRRRKPDLVVRVVGEPAIPPKGTLDPEILIWCEENGFILVTNNRKSMPIHLADRIVQGRHIPGIFILNPNLGVGENLEELLIIAGSSFDNEYRDCIEYLPLTQ